MKLDLVEIYPRDDGMFRVGTFYREEPTAEGAIGKFVAGPSLLCHSSEELCNAIEGLVRVEPVAGKV